MPPTNASPVVGLSSNVLESNDGFRGPDGIGTYTRELERALVAEGTDVRRVGAPARVGVRLIPAKHASIRFPLPLPYLTAASSALGIALPFAARIEREIDIYHATDYMIPRLASTPVVATVYDAIPIAHPEWANPRLRLVKNWLLRNSAQSADLVIAISNAAISELVEHYRIPRDRIRVVPLGVNERWFTRPDAALIAEALASHGLAPGYFLHVGTLQPRKNLDALITAYQRLPDAIRSQRQLVLVGKYGWAAEALRRRLETLRCEGRIVWLGYVNRDTLRALYYAAGAFVFPSLAEGFGLPLVEALAVGLPVIAGDLPALREVAQAHANFVSPFHVEELTQAMATLHQSADTADNASARRQHAREFSWQACATRTLDVYRELLG